MRGMTWRAVSARPHFKDLEALLGGLTPELLRSVKPTTVSLFLGTSPLRPKEIFTFVLSDLEGAYPGPGAGTEKLIA